VSPPSVETREDGAGASARPLASFCSQSRGSVLTRSKGISPVSSSSSRDASEYTSVRVSTPTREHAHCRPAGVDRPATQTSRKPAIGTPGTSMISMIFGVALSLVEGYDETP
jgi:hypothetical protein